MMFNPGSNVQLEILASGPPGAIRPRSALLFVHGLGHDATCWRNWMHAASEDGYAAYAVSLSGHGGSGGRLRSARLKDYVEDVLRAVEAVDADEIVLVGHSLGGLVVQRLLALQPTTVSAGVLVGSITSGPAFGTVFSVLRSHPWQAMRFLAGRSLRLPPDMLFERMGAEEAAEISRSLCGESPWVQYQLLFHLPAKVKSEYPLLSVHSRHDRMVPARSARATARRYGADVRELAGIGHDMMLDGGWEESWNVISDWLEALRVEAISRTARPAD
ncbi:alpha/beta hydrolase [Paenarthrobacter sp. 2TAF44]|uniref:alpha/beta hydrolase n=1 Tax=Paenarthrobacter sp. 2TAF44 TaxID=3233018 RepID=UPI003F9815BB